MSTIILVLMVFCFSAFLIVSKQRCQFTPFIPVVEISCWISKCRVQVLNEVKSVFQCLKILHDEVTFIVRVQEHMVVLFCGIEITWQHCSSFSSCIFGLHECCFSSSTCVEPSSYTQPRALMLAPPAHRLCVFGGDGILLVFCLLLKRSEEPCSPYADHHAPITVSWDTGHDSRICVHTFTSLQWMHKVTAFAST